MKISISIGQMAVQIGEPEHNEARVRDWIIEAARRGSDLVVFPELWDTGYALDRAAELGSVRDGGRFAEIAALAKVHQIHVMGSLLEKTAESSQAYNTAVWFDREGRALGAYRKIHLFRLMQEDRYLQPGNERLMLDLPWGRTSVAICYDLRFPELFRRYALDGALMTVIPAQWPHPRLAHWRTLLRARAIENQMVIVACNRVGQDGDTRFFGHSAIYDAWGETLIEGGENEALLTVTVDLSTVPAARKKIPVFEDRRPDVYER